MTIDVKKLGEALRFGGFNAANWREALCAVADKLEEEPAQTEHWIGPFEWRGGECPLPPETVVRWEVTRSVASANAFIWSSRRGHFSYLADSPEGWVARPADWFVPQGCDLQYEGGCQWGNRIEPAAPGEIASHIRILPRQPAAEPAPIPDDVRQVVREALEAANLFWLAQDPLHQSRHQSQEERVVWQKVRKALNALDALDAAPAEKVAGYAIVGSDGFLRMTLFDKDAKDACSLVRLGERIVRLVEEPMYYRADFNQHFGNYRAADVDVTCIGAPVTIDVLAKNKAEHLVITNFSNPSNGSLVYNSGDKSFTYTPAAGFVGIDSFTYTVRDQRGATATAEVTIEVVEMAQS